MRAGNTGCPPRVKRRNFPTWGAISHDATVAAAYTAASEESESQARAQKIINQAKQTLSEFLGRYMRETILNVGLQEHNKYWAKGRAKCLHATKYARTWWAVTHCLDVGHDVASKPPD